MPGPRGPMAFRRETMSCGTVAALIYINALRSTPSHRASIRPNIWRVSPAYSLDQPAEIKEHMCFAIETFAGHPRLKQTCRLEEDVLVGPDGPVILTLMEHTEEAMAGYKAADLHPSLVR